MTPSKVKGHLAILSANIIFGLNTTISRGLIPEVVSPFALTFFRMSGALLLFWGISLFTKKEKVPLKDIGMLFLASFFGIFINQFPFLVGLSHTSPIDASLVITLLPVFSMILAAIFIKEPITLKKVMGVIVGASGAILLISRHADTDIGNGSLFGNLLVMSSSFSYAVYLTLFKKTISKYSPITCMKWMFLFASIMAFPFCFPSLQATDFSAFSTTTYLKIGYVVCAATFLSYLLIPIAQKVLRPTTLSMYNYLQPIVATTVAILVGLDHFRWDKLIAGALVFTGVYLVTRSKSREQVEAEKTHHQ
ncbi:MAG: DMT family transporter [Bacteroidales bacterium]|nr:DMT family transporter [Bacteroidales bacterium]